MKLKFFISTILLLLASASLFYGQRKSDKEKPQDDKVEREPPIKCHLGLDRAPELRGFALTTPQDKVLTRFPGVILDRPDEFGVTKVQMNILDGNNYRKLAQPVKNTKPVQSSTAADPEDGRLFVLDGSRFPDLKGAKNIQLRLLDGRISFVQIGYDDAVKWEDLDDFVETISENLNLPDQWDQSFDGREKSLRCDGFTVKARMTEDSVDFQLTPVLSVEDRAAMRLTSNREKDKDDKTRQKEDQRRRAFKP